MKNGKKGNNVTTRILFTGLFILIGCLLASSIHLFQVRSIFVENAEDNLLGHIQVALEVINHEVESQKEVTLACADMLYYNQDEAINSVLKRCAQKYSGYTFYYVSPNDTTYYSNGLIMEENVFDMLSEIHTYEYKDDFICITQDAKRVKGDTVSYWIGITPVELNKFEGTGYLLSRRVSEDVFEDECFDYLMELGTCCITDRDGYLITADANYVREMGLEENFYDALLASSDKSSSSEAAIRQMRADIPIETKGNITFSADGGEKVFLAFEEIKHTRDRYLMVIFREDIVYEMIQPPLFQSFLLWVLILSIMMGTIGFVWYSGRAARRTVERLAFGDEITGGKNLNYFRKQSVEILNQNREKPFLIYRFDILNFRYINEAYGHEKADEVLKACIHEFNQIYTKNELCVRINSDHFLALVMNDIDVSQKYQQYVKAVGECAREKGVRYPIRLRLGIYQVRKDDLDIDIMIDHANAARKSMSGKEKVLEAYYSDKIASNMKKVDIIESQMQSAIVNNEFKIFLQPKWDIVNDCLVGAEALVRWIKEDGTMIYPSDFIPLFESNGFIEKLDFHMLEMLCKRIGEIRQENKYRLVPISVNQSRILINNPDYVKNVDKVISQFDSVVDNLEIEITETVFFDEKNKMIEVVKQLKELGLSLAMDDFGSGYSSLNILRDIPFDILKIDREFVSESVASQSSIVIMQKIIEMAHGLKLKVICEGVETKEQVDILRNLGCTMVQGYYYDKPIPMDDFLEKYCKIDKQSSGEEEV